MSVLERSWASVAEGRTDRRVLEGRLHDARRFLFRVVAPGHFRRYQTRRVSTGEKRSSYDGFDRTRSIFVHIPKAGGVSVAISLYGNRAGSHTSVSGYQLVFSAAEFQSYFKFTFVRNPWDRLYSAYRFLSAGGMNDLDRSWSEKHLAGVEDFEAFVLEALPRRSVRRGGSSAAAGPVPAQFDHRQDRRGFRRPLRTVRGGFRHGRAAARQGRAAAAYQRLPLRKATIAAPTRRGCDRSSSRSMRPTSRPSAISSDRRVRGHRAAATHQPAARGGARRRRRAPPARRRRGRSRWRRSPTSGRAGSRAGRRGRRARRRSPAPAAIAGGLEVVALGGEEGEERLGVGKAGGAGSGGLSRPASAAKTAAVATAARRGWRARARTAAGRGAARSSPMPRIRQARPARQTGQVGAEAEEAPRAGQRRRPRAGRAGAASRRRRRSRRRCRSRPAATWSAGARRRGRRTRSAAARRAARGCRRRRRGRGRRGRRWRARGRRRARPRRGRRRRGKTTRLSSRW